MPNQQELIKSILKGYCIGLFTFKVREDGNWEILDGQQRVNTIFTFIGERLNETLGEPDKKFKSFENFTYEQIMANAEKKPIFEGAEICYVLLPQTMTDGQTAEYFVALQEGKPLIPPERLNAMLGFVREEVVKYSGRIPLISNDKFMKDIRFSRRYLTAQFLQIELYADWKHNPPAFPNYRAEELKELYIDYSKPTETKQRTIVKALDKIQSVMKIIEITLKKDMKFVSSFGYLIPVYLLTSYLWGGKYAYDLNVYRKLIIDFRVKVNTAKKNRDK